MAINNSIALQARAPQTDILGGSIQRNAQMINMMRQQDVAERQAATAAKNAEIAAAQEGRAVAKEARDASAAEIELAGKQIDFYTKLAGQVMNANGYNMLLTRLDKDVPEIAQAFRANLPPEQFDRNMLLQMVGSIGDNFKATYGPLETQVIQDADGNYGVATSGGFSAERGQQGVVPLNVLQPKTGARPPAAGGNAPAGGLRPTRGANTTPADIRAQMAPAGPATPDRLEAAARAAARGARATDPIFDGLTDDEFRQMQTRADEIRAGNASMKPASFDGGAAQPDLGGIVQQMMQTGVVSQSNLQALRAAAGPDKEQQLAQILRSSNIKIMPDEGQAGGMRDAVYRPDEGMPTLQRTQGMVRYEDTGRQFKGKSPMVSPSSPSKSPEQIYREERAKEQARVDAARNAGPKPLTPAQEAKLRDNIAKDYKSAQSTLNMMLDPTSGIIAAVNNVRKLSPDQKEAITGYSGYLPTVYASTKTADTKVKNLKGKVTEMGKAAASLTGAIGQMAVQEWKIVSDMIANLDLEGMGAKDLDDQLDIIEAQARRAAEVTRDAYENQYVEEFARYPGRFQLKAPSPAQGGNRRTPIRGGVDKNNPLLKGM